MNEVEEAKEVEEVEEKPRRLGGSHRYKGWRVTQEVPR